MQNGWIWRAGSRTALALALLSVWTPASSPRAQSKRPMSLVDLLNIPRVGDPQLSGDGRLLTFGLQTTDWPGNRRVLQIWEIRADGSGLRRLTSGASAFNARWSPDGSTIAYLSGGNVFLMAADGGSMRQLSHHATGVSDIAWSPDGAAIYFLATDPPTEEERARESLRGDVNVLDEFRQKHLWKISIADGRETRVTSGSFSVYAFKIGPGGRRIIFSRRPTSLVADTDKIELWSLDPAAGTSVQLTHNSVPEEGGELSPDGTQVLFLARANDRLESYYNANLFLLPAAGGTPRALMPAFQYEVLNAGWDPDGKSIWMVVNMGVHSELFQVDLATRKPRQVTSGEHSIVPQFWSISSGRHVLMFDEPTRIGEVWTLAPGASTPVKVTGITDYLERDFAMPRQERIEWKGADGVTIEGILTYPIDYKAGTRYPLVVQLHGGPEDSDKFGPGTIFLTYQPALAAQGYAMLRPNYRGSSGYGNVAYRDPVGGYFKNNYHDVLAGVDRAIAMGVADPDRLAIMGESAGAHLVNKLITYTTRFKAASSYSGVANWISLYGQTDTRGDRDLWLGGTLWQKNAPIETYWEQSPLKYITQARTPTLFFIGENDPRVPMAQSVEMVRALKAQGVPSELYSYPGEGHTIQKPSHQLHKMNTEMTWFNKYLRGLPYTPEPDPTANDPKVVPAP
jgi:dipeptidyl aminopeptidase/acylaminoacyl peptidase